MTFDYKKYSLEQLDNWVHDAISGEATPQEIYDVIKGVVDEQYHYFKLQTGRCYELLCLLNGNGNGHIQAYDDYVKEVLAEKEYYESSISSDKPSNFTGENTVCDKDDPSPECKSQWTKFWEDQPYPLYVSEDGDIFTEDIVKKDKVNRWILPVEVDGLTGDCYINLPDDLLEAADLKEGDQVEWIDNNDGTFILKKSG